MVALISVGLFTSPGLALKVVVIGATAEGSIQSTFSSEMVSLALV